MIKRRFLPSPSPVGSVLRALAPGHRLAFTLIALAVNLCLCACRAPSRTGTTHELPTGADPPAASAQAIPKTDAAGGAQTPLEAGKVAYERYCKLCHGEDAVGYAADHANQLRNPSFLATATPPFLSAAIKYGRPGTPMAGFWTRIGGPLDDEQVDHIVDYIRSLAQVDVGSVMITGDIPRGEKLFQLHCAQCHGDQGQGGSAPSLNNPYFLATATDGFLQYAITYGRPGTPMKGFQDRLDDQQVGDLTRFVRSRARNVPYASEVGEVFPKLEELVLNPSHASRTFPLLTQRYVPAENVAAAMREHVRIVLLDARPKSDWIASHIPGSYPVPFYNQLDANLLKALPRDGTWIVTYCSCPHAASDKVMDALRKEGFANTAVIEEGFLEWTRRKYPVTFGRAD